MHFSPSNPIVQLCLQAMKLDEGMQRDEAEVVRMQAWKSSSNDFEKFLSAYFLAKGSGENDEKLHWFDRTLEHALRVDDVATRSALATVLNAMAECQEELGDSAAAQRYREQAEKHARVVRETGPFFHGTKADVQVGDLLIAGYGSNYQTGLIMNHIYFTALPQGAGLAAALASGEGAERVYVVVPTGPFEPDPNVTDKKFPGNLTRSYRSAHALTVVGELRDWTKQTEESIQHWRERLASNRAEIIN